MWLYVHNDIKITCLSGSSSYKNVLQNYNVTEIEYSGNFCLNLDLITQQLKSCAEFKNHHRGLL